MPTRSSTGEDLKSTCSKTNVRKKTQDQGETYETSQQIFAVPITIALILAALRISRASIPDAGGVIHGCYQKSGGAIRIIDNSVTPCGSNETSLSWNQTGPAGPMGPAGPAGPAGPSGVSGYEVIQGAAANVERGALGDSFAFCSSEEARWWRVWRQWASTIFDLFQRATLSKYSTSWLGGHHKQRIDWHPSGLRLCDLRDRVINTRGVGN